MSDPLPNPGGADIVVLLGTSWARLAEQNTRWRAVLQEWATDGRVASIRIVDYPSMSVRNLTRRLAEPLASWDPRIDAVTGRVPLPSRPSPVDALGWRATARALNGVLTPRGAQRVAIAATPLWVPVLRHLRVNSTGFDGVDDWRALPAVARVSDRVVAGYTAAARVDSATTVSPTLTQRLRSDFAISATTVANGVDLAEYTAANTTSPYDLPAEPFAVYVGVVQQRVDAALLAAVAARMPVVIAGPIHASMTEQIAQLPVLALGRVPTAEVAGLLKAAAVGLIPHHINALTESMDPMKLREYLAAGLPVITTVAPPADLRSDRVFVATEPESFGNAAVAARGLPALGQPDPRVTHRTWATVGEELFAAHVSA